MDKLNLYNNKLGDEEIVHLSKCIHKVKRLDISHCGITSNVMKNLSKAIMKLDKPVRILFSIFQ